jgi:hypothetical protein
MDKVGRNNWYFPNLSGPNTILNENIKKKKSCENMTTITDTSFECQLMPDGTAKEAERHITPILATT